MVQIFKNKVHWASATNTTEAKAKVAADNEAGATYQIVE